MVFLFFMSPYLVTRLHGYYLLPVGYSLDHIAIASLCRPQSWEHVGSDFKPSIDYAHRRYLLRPVPVAAIVFKPMVVSLGSTGSIPGRGTVMANCGKIYNEIKRQVDGAA
jgi:hypothetical protein